MIVPLTPNCFGPPGPSGSETRWLITRPATPVTRLNPRVQRNMRRISGDTLLAVAAGTMSSALMRRTPTAVIEKLTINASSTTNR